MHDPYRALYLHIPFCKQRCLYCDFFTEAVQRDDARITDYIERLVMDIRNAAHEGFLSQIETVYFGGGTPTYLAGGLTQLLYTLSLFMMLGEKVECTIEANPESLDNKLVADLWALGANRLSIGVQSFDDAILARLGRIHDADRARRAIESARTRFDNVSVDLMCGIPGQTTDSLAASISEAVTLGAKHVSIYPLSIEEGSPLAALCQAGEFPWPEEDVQAEHMECAASVLEQAGFERYEVASYALPGYACRHNIAYWTGVPYLGLGDSAVTMTQNSQRRMRKQHDMVIDDLDAKQMLAEDLMLRMRMSAGISDVLVDQASAQLSGLTERLANLAERGFVVHEHGAWRPTRQGWLCGNELYGALFDLAP